MEYIKIQGCNKPVSRLIKGTDYFFHDKYELAAANLDAYLAIGGNTVDTAHIYCGGQSEEVLGKYFQERGNRDHWVILTKGAHPDAGRSKVNRNGITSDLAISFQRLQTDYIDLYALHRDDTSVPVSEIIDCLNEYIANGQIGAIGVSNWTTARIAEANQYAEQHGLVGFTFSSPNLSLAKPNEPFWRGCESIDEESSSWHTETQLPVLSWSSQARGFFTGRYSPQVTDNADMVRVFYNDENWERLRRAELLAEQKGVTTIQIALAYVLNQPYPTCALIGAQKKEELLSCDEGARIKLTEQEIDWLDLKN